jgi:uncharacterized protein YjbI with pentapeptide repeats
MANLSKVELYHADLKEADLSEANLSEAKFYRTNLSKANLSKAKLFGIDLISDLENFRRNYYIIDFTIDLCCANLMGVDLSTVNLIAIKYDNATIWPEGFNPAQIQPWEIDRI